MPRQKQRDVEMERLTYENTRLREQIQRLREIPPDYPFLACDNSCLIATPRGMSTNGGCRCDERRILAACLYWRRRSEFLQATIQELRGDGRTEDTVRGLAERFITERSNPFG